MAFKRSGVQFPLAPFSLFKKKAGKSLVWFWDSKAGGYTVFRSTGVPVEGKRERKREAEQKAREMLPEIRLDMEAVAAPSSSILKNFGSLTLPM